MKQKIKRFLCCCLAACQLFTITAHAAPEWPSDTGIQAEAGIVIDADSGAVLFAQNSHVAYPPASITKLLTALLVLENCQLDETVTFSHDAMHNVEADSGNKLSLVEGDTMTVEDALYALLLVSVNQAANALAEHVAGTMPDFVNMMNEKLTQLGCKESHFDNPSGLNGDTQYVSAYDMSLIARAAFANETLRSISASHSHKIAPTTNNPDGITVYQEHRLVITEDSSSPYYYPAAVAGKTGYLIKAGNTLVTYAEQDGRRLISVILKGQPRQYFLDSKSLLEFGFGSFQNVYIADQEQSYVTGDTPMTFGNHSFQPSDLMIEEGRVVTLPHGASLQDAKMELITELPQDHPENAVALLNYTYNDRKIGEAYLMAKELPEGFQLDPDAPAAAGTTPDETQDPSGAPEETPAQTQAPDAQPANPDNTSRTPANPASVLAFVLVLAAILAAGGLCALILVIRKKRREEAEAVARRRERRRQRLQQEGDEDEFNRLLEERLQKSQKK